MGDLIIRFILGSFYGLLYSSPKPKKPEFKGNIERPVETKKVHLSDEK